jgi:hypothetical protein
MQSGIRNVVRMTNSIEMPSTPIGRRSARSQAAMSSTIWKPGWLGSKLAQISSDMMKVTVVPAARLRGCCGVHLVIADRISR